MNNFDKINSNYFFKNDALVCKKILPVAKNETLESNKFSVFLFE